MRTSTLLLAITVAAGLSSTAPAEEARSLPIYTTEEETTNTLESALKEAISKSEVTLDSLKPREPLKEKGFVAIGLQANCSGSLEQVTALLAKIAEQPFSAFPAVRFTQDRKDPALMRAAIEMLQWHAAKDKTADKVRKWNRIAKPSPSPLELYRTCTDVLPEKGVSITSFSAEKGSVIIIGQASNTNQARIYGAKLFQRAEAMPGYSWQWLQRPVLDPRKKMAQPRSGFS